VTGASTRCTLDSSTRISLALAQIALTSDSFKYSHLRSAAICRSKSLTEPPLASVCLGWIGAVDLAVSEPAPVPVVVVSEEELNSTTLVDSASRGVSTFATASLIISVWQKKVQGTGEVGR
jgi:hypothetical protein